MRKGTSNRFCLRGHDTSITGRAHNHNCVKCTTERSRKSYMERGMKATYGVDTAEYNRLLEVQKGLCRICRKAPERRALAVDHDHKTDRVRGLLCTKCNLMLGFASDDITLLKAGIEYLQL